MGKDYLLSLWISDHIKFQYHSCGLKPIIGVLCFLLFEESSKNSLILIYNKTAMKPLHEKKDDLTMGHANKIYHFNSNDKLLK